MIDFKWNIPKMPLFNTKSATALFGKETNKLLNNVTSAVQTNVKFSAPVGTEGLLRNTIGTSVQKRPGGMAFTGRVFTGVAYGPIIERGRGAAPVAESADILRWIRLSKRGRAYYSALQQSYPGITRKQADFLLRRSMKRTKRKANPFFARGVKRSNNKITKEFQIFSGKIARGLLGL